MVVDLESEFSNKFGPDQKNCKLLFVTKWTNEIKLEIKINEKLI